ncbi:phosphate ABC transporter substrate-binding protein [Vulcanibacillus modesticaldus]|uniref:Phosphate-binding protein n=1 Tax=Vulcanibacillus modesticaldus TaxID=337097 RepID=A0A1D2YSX4_9BACI|nr:PstS family phosphate ABC transporter substrate-binding protein [Vulcanibacillus modesticaldus]OEF98092.1 phosphate ABC transporter substrate-binding protein [Vulcanibacillus modesticaldus]
MKKLALFFIMATLILVLTACGNQEDSVDGGLSGIVKIDGSSTVFPITEAVAEEFQIANNKVQVTVGVSGTGGGFKKFTIGETDINDASRPIKDSEIAKTKENNINYLELPVAYDGLSVVVNKENDWVDYLTIDELKKIWEPNSQITKWSQVRPGWPDEEIKLYGPGTDSGTFDYFTEEIIGESGASRSDYTASEDDNVLVKGIEGDKYSLGYFGFAYYVENKERMKVVPIDAGNGPIVPTLKTINDGSYSPLSRPLFIYVNTESLKRPEVYEFVKFYMENAQLAEEVGYVRLPQNQYDENLQAIAAYQQ